MMIPSLCCHSISLLLIIIASRVEAICYYPDGSVSPQDTPCSDQTSESTCCGQGYACLTNNICMATGAELQKPDASIYVRGSCTDKNWRSSNCPLFCINPAAPFNDNVSGGAGISKCPGNKDMYYCVDFATDQVNCTTEKNVLIFQGAFCFALPALLKRAEAFGGKWSC